MVLKYPEMKNYSWVKDLERVTKNSKAVPGSMKMSEIPKVPLTLAIEVINESMSYVEVMNAYASAPSNGQIPQKEGHLLDWFYEYLLHKHGNLPNPAREVMFFLRKIANNEYSGVDDPELINDLLASPGILENGSE